MQRMNDGISAEHSHPNDADSNAAGSAEPWPRHLKALEISLSGLVPRAEGLDTDRIALMAQRIAARSRSRRLWQHRALQLWAVAMTAVAVLLTVLLVRAERKLERLARTEAAPVAHAPADQPPPPALARSDVSDPRMHHSEDSQTGPIPRATSVPDDAPTMVSPIRSLGQGTRYGPRAPYLALLDRLLRENFDHDLTPKKFMEELRQRKAAGETAPQMPRVLRYQEWLKILLDEQDSWGTRNTEFRTPSLTGASL